MGISIVPQIVGKVTEVIPISTLYCFDNVLNAFSLELNAAEGTDYI